MKGIQRGMTDARLRGALRLAPLAVRRLAVRPLIAILIITLFAACPVVAASRTANALSSCIEDGGEAVTIRTIAADLTVVLEDGRTILPAGVDPVRPTPHSPHLADDAREKLQGWLAGRPAVVRPLDNSPDRWGRTRALLFAAPGPATQPPATESLLSISLALVDAGLARARAEPDIHACWSGLLAAEHAARAAGLGLWADPFYAVRDAGDAAQLAEASGGMALVRGRVTRIGRGRSRLYVGMGGGGADFTLRIAKREAGVLSELGLGADGLIGSTLLVRGFLDDRFGPSIEVTGADQISVVNRAATGHNTNETIPR